MANKSSSGGMSLFTILFIVFLVLKLTGSITWSWWWVIAPLWIPALITISFFLLFGLLAFIVSKS